MEHSARDLPTVYVLCTKSHRFQPGFCCASDAVPTHVATGQCGHRTFGMDVGWFYNDGGRFTDTFFIVEDSGRQCKTVIDSARQCETVEDSGRVLPTFYVVWQTMVDSGSQWKTVEDSGRQ